jgi:hypothetical protein
MALPDLMEKRFTATPLEIIIGLSGRRIRVETNSQAVAGQLQRTLPPYKSSTSSSPDFVLRIVADLDADFDLEGTPTIHRLSHDGLSLIRLGPKNFLACDQQAREGICFISQNLVTDEKRFRSYVVPALLSLFTESLGASS